MCNAIVVPISATRILRRGLSLDQMTGRIPVDVGAKHSVHFPAETCGDLDQEIANERTSRWNPRCSSDCTFSATGNLRGFEADPAAVIGAAPAGILREVLLVIVRSEAGNPTRAPPLTPGVALFSRLPVDVEGVPTVDQTRARLCLRTNEILRPAGNCKGQPPQQLKRRISPSDRARQSAAL